MHDCLMHKKICKFTLECTFYLDFGECYIFLTKYDLCVYSRTATCTSRNMLV